MSLLRITYSNQLAVSEFAMQDQVNLMKGEAAILKSILGDTTELDGLGCTPNSPADLTVIVEPGTIIINEDVLSTAFGQLPTQIPADTTHQIVKYAYNLDSTQIPIAPPTTPGFSQNDLIQIGFSEVDGNPQPIPFFNGFNGQVINPAVPQTLNTQRIDSVVISLKEGTPAATGSQVTPSPDPGYVGAWVVTTAEGQTSITSGDIAMYPGAPFILEKLKDKISQATADARYAQLAVDNTFTQPQTIPAYFASVHMSAIQSLPPNNIGTVVNFDTVEYDPFSLWGGSNQFVINKEGLYEANVILYSHQPPGTYDGSIFIMIYKNGVLYKRLNEIPLKENDITLFGSIDVPCNVGDTLHVVASNADTTHTLSLGGDGVTTTPPTVTAFQIRYVGSV